MIFKISIANDGTIPAKLIRICKFFAGKTVFIEIEKFNPKRSNQQNKYYWEVLTIIGNELGYTKNEMHGIFKDMFLKDLAISTKSGETKEYIRSTATLKTNEFAIYLDRIIQFASENGILIFTPEEFYQT